MTRLIPTLFFACAYAALSLVAGGPASGDENVKAVAYGDNGYADLDPAHASLFRVNDERLILALYEGLTTLDPETGKAQPGAAESWTSSADGKTWTFKLRKDGKWSDGSPVTAKDFVFAWSRVIDPYTESHWTWLFRSIKGCGVITDNAARIDGYNILRSGLKDLRASNPNGIPGDQVNLLLDETGVRPFLTQIKSRSVKKMLSWKEGDLFPPEMVTKTIDALKKEKKDLKEEWEKDFEAFGKSGSGIHASDATTLVVTTEGDVPFLPELLARSVFCPLHKSVETKRDKAFDPGSLIGNGPFVLHGRGAKPPEDQQEKRVLSVVDLTRSPTYNGPNKAKLDRLKCITDQGAKEDIVEYKKGGLQWVNTTWSEYPDKKKMRPEIEALKGFGVRDTPVVLYLRFRCDRAPFDNKDARKAFALSINRADVAKQFWPEATPAFRLVPPGIEGRVEDVSCPKPDDGAAQAAYKASGVTNETWVELSFGEAPGQDNAARELIKDWKKVLKLESSSRIENDADVRRILRSGKYYSMVTAMRGYANDPSAYLAPLHSGDADSGLGWRDDAYDALVDAARDPDTALSNPEKFLSTTGASELQGALDAAKSGQDGRLRFRREALAAAERRIMDEYVVVPLCFLKEAILVGDVKGLGSDGARRNPGFIGALWHVDR
jgi:ABC-type oligopeptide transport system substrate-binding subunit